MAAKIEVVGQMWINSVELRNIKSYRDCEVPFRYGVNGISGENGAGKTTILESIGFALFDHLPYSQKDFLRRGEKAGDVRVHVVAPDELEYVIARSVKGDYRVESQVGRIAVGKVDVQDWIVENLFSGAITSADLSSIFENAVGVPQGTFTSSFLAPPRARKEVFDSILRVDEYRKAFDNLNDVSKIVKTEIDDMEKRHHELKGSTAKYRGLKERFEHEKIAVSRIKEEIAGLERELAQLQLKKDDLGKKKELIDSTRKELEKLERDVTELEKHLATAKKDLGEATSAKKILDETKDAKERYLESQDKLKELEGDKKKRDHLDKQRLEQENKIKRMKEELDRKKNLLKEVEDHHKELKEIEPAVKEQKELEEEIKEIEGSIRDVKQMESDIDDLKRSMKELGTLSKRLEELEREQNRIEPDVKMQEELESRKQIITGKKSAVNSEIKSIRKKKKETGETNQCPILDGVKCVAVTSFSDYFEDKLSEKKKGLDSIEGELKLIETELKELNNPVKRMGQNKSKISEIKGELKGKMDVQDKLQQRQTRMDESHKIFSERYASYVISIPDAKLAEKMEKAGEIMKTRLKELNNPDRQASKVSTLADAKIKEMDKIKIDENGIKIEESGVFEIKLGLSEFSDIDPMEKEIRKILEGCEPHYRKYLQNEKNAGKVNTYRNISDKLDREISKKASEKENHARSLDECKSVFAEREFEQTKKEHEEGNIKFNSKKTEYNMTLKNLGELEKELNDMESLIRQKERLKEECGSKKGFLNYIEFIRTTLKDSAQIIAGKLIKNIGEEANRIYCDIINDYTQELRWTHDYAITITEHGEEKGFGQLSGGEQMSSSLAVRFALLKILSGCDVVFLDEPTQNMDEIRREKLSEQILNISGFKQIFVISHDDTFNEKYENVIKVEKIGGESRVIAEGGVS